MPKFKTIVKALVPLAVLGLAGFWVLTIPHPLTADQLPKHTADVTNGEKLFHASGCHSCHLPSKDSGLDEASVAGGAPLKTPIGTLYPPNLTPDPETGIGNWTDLQFLNAVMRGISPEALTALRTSSSDNTLQEQTIKAGLPK